MKLTRRHYPALKTRLWAAVLDLAICRLFKIRVKTEWYDIEDRLREGRSNIEIIIRRRETL